jgi:cell division protein FtsW (lipid II flippase)
MTIINKIKEIKPFERNKYIDKTLMNTIFILSIFGILMNISASMGRYVDNNTALMFYSIKQIVYLLTGFFILNYTSVNFDFKKMKNLFNSPIFIYIVWIILLLCRLFPSVSGAHAWIKLPGFTLQPSEFAKIFTILVIANTLGGVKSKKFDAKTLLRAPLSQIIPVFLIVFIVQSDLGSAVIISFIAYILILICRHPSLKKVQKWMFWVMIIGLVGLFFLFSKTFSDLLLSFDSSNYMVNRFTSAIDPFRDPYNGGYQIIKGLVSMASGGIVGLGFGQSIRKYMNFPAANSDYIIAIIIEELGLIGFVILIILYLFILGILIRYALIIKNEKAKIILFGVALYFFIHFLFNVGGASTLIPLTGVPLLLVSSGGSSLLSCMLSLGICQAIIAMYKKGEIK